MAARPFAIRDLRNHTSAVLEAARRDGEALISSHGKVIARLTPVEVDGVTERDDFVSWIATWAASDTGWAASFDGDKRRDAEAAQEKPWE